MQFKEALELMIKKDAKVKLPAWGGYWCWDEEKQTVMMHCRPKDTDEGQGPVIDIRDTQRVQYTLENVCSDKWIVANEKNCPVLGGVATFDFQTALKYLKRGLPMRRKGWIINENVKYTYLTYNYDGESFIGYIVYNNGDKEVKYYDEMPVSDMMADDWCFAEIEGGK